MSIEQQPVAWRFVNKETNLTTIGTDLTSFLYHRELFEITPLYAAPPKRERLSDEEVRAKYRDIALDNPLYVPSYYAGFRDAEKAHGIGGGK